MPDDFMAASQQSRNDFVRLLQRPLEKLLEGKIVPTEENGEIGRLLDMRAGIDAILVHPRFGLFGIGVRIQYGQNYRTFTIRKQRESLMKTEYAKHTGAMDEGGLTTKFNIQAYIDRETGKLLGAAIAMTDDIHYCIDSGICDRRVTGNDQIGHATFYVVEWATLRYNNIGPMWIHEFHPKKEGNLLCQ